MQLEKLANFLREANKSTYANKDASKVLSERLGSLDYHFEKENLVYHDTYFGVRDFIGEEIVYEDLKPVWGANYYGFILDESIDENELYEFLRQSLMEEWNNVLPVRGPKSFSSGNWKYQFITEGILSRFSGKEEISFGSDIVYSCFVHGGMIQ